MMEAKMPIICRFCEKVRIRPESAAIVALWIAVLLVIIWAFNHAAQIIGAVSQTFAAVIAAAGAILVAILTHVLTQYREQRKEQQRALQENYLKLLEEIGELVRKRAPNDAFSTLFLKISILGTPNVMEKSKAIMDVPPGKNRAKALSELLEAMREDIGVKYINIKLPDTLFLTPGGLNSTSP
jgi:hypothetical protein